VVRNVNGYYVSRKGTWWWLLLRRIDDACGWVSYYMANQMWVRVRVRAIY
jgi:hypothetical protein